MASHSQPSSAFEPLHGTIDKLPSATLKRHPKMDWNKTDLLSLLSYLEGELQARDVGIAALKAEKAKQLLYQAKYGRFGLGDPFLALQRDSDKERDNSFDEAAIKAMYDNQLMQLENLIATQRKAQIRMREQLAAVEKRYHKVCAELEEEKKKHAQRTAEGEDVTSMLEKERDRLTQELEFESGQHQKLEKDMAETSKLYEEEKAMSEKHKQVALLLIKERQRLVERLLQSEAKCGQAVQLFDKEKTKTKSMAEGLVQESKKSLKMEAALEKQLSEFDVEREQLKGRLTREENKNKDLQLEVQALKQQIEMLQKQLVAGGRRDGPQSIEIHSGVSPRTPPVGSLGHVNKIPKGYRTTPPSTPPESRRLPGAGAVAPPVPHYESPERDLPQTLPASGGDTMVRRAVMHLPHGGNTSPRPKEHTVVEKYIPVEKKETSPRITIGGSGTQVIQASSGTTVFTTPQGTKISLNVGSSPHVTRKPSTPQQVSRGTPPPLPPNKPMYVPQGTPRNNGTRPGSGRTDTASPAPGNKPQVPTKFGITITKDKITITNPEGPEDIHRIQGGPKNVTITPGQTGGTIVSGGGEGPRKTSQVCLNYK